MNARKSKTTTRKKADWPYTPEPSPPPSPTIVSISQQRHKMSTEGSSRSRPISVTSSRAGMLSPVPRPTLDDVLNGRAPAPYTLAAFTAFLSEQHCLETLEFTVESKKYQEKFDEASASLAGMPLTVDTDEGFELQQEWLRILDVYVKPGAPREINLPAIERDTLVDLPYQMRPPDPETLQPSIKRMRDLMGESIFIPFCERVRAVPHARTYDSHSDYMDRHRPEQSARHSGDSQHKSSQRHPSPASSSSFQPSRSPPQKQTSRSSNITSGLSKTSANRISTYKTNTSVTSAASEGAITDDSASGDGGMPVDRDLLSPPITPPAGELGSQSSSSNYLSSSAPRPQRTESKGWTGMKKMWSNKKKGTGGSVSRDDASR